MTEAESFKGRSLEDALREMSRQLADVRSERDALASRLGDALASQKALDEKARYHVRNLLAVVRSILRRTLETSPSEDFADHFTGRLDAVARYQVTGLEGLDRSIGLEDIIRDELLPTRCLDTPSCVISGPPVYFGDRTIEPMTLATHELATNALKFGALCRNGAKLMIEWSVSDGDAGPVLHLRWAESGVPIVGAAPPSRGFGRQYIEEGLPYQLRAKTSFEFRPGGVVCTITLPLDGVGVAIGQTKVVGPARSRAGAAPQG